MLPYKELLHFPSEDAKKIAHFLLEYDNLDLLQRFIKVVEKVPVGEDRTAILGACVEATLEEKFAMQEREGRRQELERRMRNNELKPMKVKNDHDMEWFIDAACQQFRERHPHEMRISDTAFRCQVQYGCYYDTRNALILDVTRKTMLTTPMRCHLQGRIEHVVFLAISADLQTGAPYPIYIWDTRFSNHLQDLPIHDMSDRSGYERHSKWQTHGRWMYSIHWHINGGTHIQVKHSKMTREMLARFYINNSYSTTFTVREEDGVVIIPYNEGTFEYHLTELERIRVETLEPVLENVDLRRKVLSFLVLEEHWAYPSPKETSQRDIAYGDRSQ
jgi:hypothetical protein